VSEEGREEREKTKGRYSPSLVVGGSGHSEKETGDAGADTYVCGWLSRKTADVGAGSAGDGTCAGLESAALVVQPT